MSAVPGVAAVQVDVPTKRVEVRYDPAVVGEARIVAGLDDEGYPVELR
ncbi:MAG: heavy-metal-associated domain-containing protein [Chloroflexota bacterium]